MSNIRLCFKLFFFFFCIVNLYPQTKDLAEVYQQKSTEVQKIYAKEYLSLAKWCRAYRLFDEAEEHFKTVLNFEPENEVAKKELKKLASKTTLPLENTEQLFDELDQKLLALKKKLADEHTKLGIWCRKNKLVEKAQNEFAIATTFCEDHSQARKELGQEKVKGFGWVDKDTATKLKQGLREYQGKWLPKNDVEKIRSNWDNAWEVKTRHYLIKTNTSPERGYEVAQLAEDLYEMYFKVFGKDLNLKDPADPLVVYFFKSAEDFKTEYTTKHGGSPPGEYGFYSNDDNIAHFWDNYTATAATLGTTFQDTILHECTHQLNHLVGCAAGADEKDLSLIAKGAGKTESWIEEGLASYFESVRRNQKGRLCVGDKIHYRFHALGKIKALKEIVSYRSKEMQEVGNEYYALGAIVVRFFLNEQGQKYKTQFMAYIKRHFTAPIDPAQGYTRPIDPLKAFEECFAGVDLNKLEKDFKEGWNK